MLFSDVFVLTNKNHSIGFIPRQCLVASLGNRNAIAHITLIMNLANRALYHLSHFGGNDEIGILFLTPLNDFR